VHVAKSRNREAWLEEAVVHLRDFFVEADIELPPVRVSVGWPSRGGRARVRLVVGQCCGPSLCADGVQQVYISPVVGEPLKVLGILLHELAHAADRCKHGHRPRFAAIARKIGLEGKPTRAKPGSAMEPRLNGILARLGRYPHAAVTRNESEKQSTRLIKVMCADCGYTARVTRKWLVFRGAPFCPCQNDEPARMVVEGNAESVVNGLSRGTKRGAGWRNILKSSGRTQRGTR
jgi:hypothetical protein